MNYLLDRLKEPSTWRGLVFLSTTLGLQVSPEHTEAVISLGLLCAGIIGVITKDKGN